MRYNSFYKENGEDIKSFVKHFEKGSKIKLRNIVARIKDLKTEQYFLLIALIAGLLFVFLTPPIAVVDEENHFFRALELSKGNVFTDNLHHDGAYGADLPENMVYYVYQNKGIGLGLVPLHDPGTAALGRQKPDASKLREVVYNGSAAYSPAGYIPQATGMLIARAANLNNEAYVYFGRVLNLLLFIVVTFFAIRIIPIGKKILFTVALLPMTLFQAASLSMDATAISSAFLLLALTVALIGNKKLPRPPLIIALIVAAGFVALTKYIYLVMTIPVLIYWAFSRERTDRTKSIAIAAITVVVALALALEWNLRLPPEVTSSAVVLDSGSKVISVSHQISYVVTHPFAYAKSVINLLFFDGGTADLAIRGIIGKYGWLMDHHFTPLVSMMVGFGALLLSVTVERHTRYTKSLQTNLSTRARRVYLTILILSAFAAAMGVITSLYAAFTSVGSNVIIGVQGRYFIPILPELMLGFALINPWIIEKLNIRRATGLLYGLVIFNMVYALTVILNDYYI